MITRVFATVTALGTLGLVAVLALLLVSVRVDGLTNPLPKWAACAIGDSPSCLRAEHQALRDRVAALREDARRLENGLTEGRMRFTEGRPADGLRVITGAIHAGTAGESGLIKVICWAIRDRRGLDPRITIAQYRPGSGIHAVTPSDAARNRLGVSPDAIAKARRNCPWPGQS